MAVPFTCTIALLGVLLLLTASQPSHGLRVSTVVNQPLRGSYDRKLLAPDAIDMADAVQSADAADSADSQGSADILQASEGLTAAGSTEAADAIQQCKLGYCRTRSGVTYCQCKYMGCSEWFCYKQGGGPTTDGSPGNNPTNPYYSNVVNTGVPCFWKGYTIPSGGGVPCGPNPGDVMMCINGELKQNGWCA